MTEVPKNPSKDPREILNLLHHALRWNDYNPGHSDYTPSSLLRPPQQTWLAVNNDPQDMKIYQGFMSFMGTMCHTVLERLAAEIDGVISEVRYYHTFQGVGLGEKKDIVVGGQIDFARPPFLVDYKVTTTRNFSLKGNDGAKEEHVEQAQINMFLMHKNGVECDVATIAYLFRDWAWGNTQVDPSYPKEPDKNFCFDRDRLEDIEARILFRIREHEEAKLGRARPCTKDEMWARDDSFAVKKPGNKRARRVFSTKEEARAALKSGEILEVRKGERVRCKSWCPFSHVCPQYKDYLNQRGEE